MRFVDEVTVTVTGGRGGDGILSFRRGPNLPKGGPDGGNGGRGGSIVLRGSNSLNTLVDFTGRKHLTAESGKRGGSNEKRGASGEDLIVVVPCGTTVIDDESLLTLGDVCNHGEDLCVAHGGVPGRGNASFRSSTNRAPRQVTPGRDGEARRLRLQLRVLADVGLLGLPNAGKSTLISRVSASRPKIADYPFTTLRPNLGVVRIGTDDGFVVADVPGLIPGASAGAGLGTRFLRHLSRTRILLHLVDCVPPDGSNPIENVGLVENELFRFSEAFRERPIRVVLNKIDAMTSEDVTELVSHFRQAMPEREVWCISGIAGTGVAALMNELSMEVVRFRSVSREDPDALSADEDVRERLSEDVLRNELQARRRKEMDSWAQQPKQPSSNIDPVS